MIMQKCVVCGKEVDVDNCFGVIDKDKTFCDAHENIRLALVELEKLGNEIHSLKIHYDSAYKVIRSHLVK